MVEMCTFSRLFSGKATNVPRHVSRIAIWIMGLSLAWLTGCASPSSLSRAVVEEPNQLVRLEVTYRDGGQEHSHPAKVTPETLVRVLQSVTVTPHSFLFPNVKNEEGDAAFSGEPLRFFAQHVSRALSQATPLEEILFYWSEKRDHSIQEITSGSCYIQDQSLHLVFANYRQAISGKLQADQARVNPRRILGGPLYRLQPGARGQIQPTSQWEHFLETSPQHLVLAYQEVENSTPSSMPHSTLQTPSSDATTPSNVQEKLETLQLLRQKGLISEEEYHEKRKQILERF